MLLNAEELLALLNGDAGPDRVADLLDRLEHCPESAASLQVLVSLRAHREEALAALRTATDQDAPVIPIPHPSARRAASSPSWARQGLRLAATVALVAIVSVWAANGYFAPDGNVDTTILKTKVYANSVGPGGPATVTLTSDTYAAINEASVAMDAARYDDALRLLEKDETLSSEDAARVRLYIGMCHYFLEDYEAALLDFQAARGLPDNGESAIPHQAAWYEANTLLALDQPTNALGVLETIKSDSADFPFHADAVDVYARLREGLGLTAPKQD